MLSDAAAENTENKKMLKNKNILGGYVCSKIHHSYFLFTQYAYQKPFGRHHCVNKWSVTSYHFPSTPNKVKFDFCIDYLVLDTLLQILARLIPSANDVAGRLSLSKDVFQSPKAKKAFGKEICNELAKLLENAKGEEWTKARFSLAFFRASLQLTGCRQTTEEFIAAIARTNVLKLVRSILPGNCDPYTFPSDLNHFIS